MCSAGFTVEASSSVPISIIVMPGIIAASAMIGEPHSGQKRRVVD